MIGKVFDYKTRNHRLSRRAHQAEDSTVQAQLREWNKLYVEQDGTLHFHGVQKEKCSEHGEKRLKVYIYTS